MNKLIKVNKGNRFLFYGIFEKSITRYIQYKGVFEYTILRDIRDEYGNYICNFIEFKEVEGFKRLNLISGESVSFRARIVICQNASDSIEGFINPYSGIYYRLMNPTKITRLICPVESLNITHNKKIY